MKYPLAIINRLMDVYGSDILVGYDITCAFARTVAKSSLSQRVKDLRLGGIVPAFHGHGHNRGCQVYWHPRYFDGAGKEDFEGCERLFSASNHLASGTRLASTFHRRQAIEEFFDHWNVLKHEESGKSRAVSRSVGCRWALTYCPQAISFSTITVRHSPSSEKALRPSGLSVQRSASRRLTSSATSSKSESTSAVARRSVRRLCARLNTLRL